MVISKHVLSYCSLCECKIVVCITCGNNCCNGGYGTFDGDKCSDCPDAYDMQELYWKDHTSVTFTGEELRIPKCPQVFVLGDYLSKLTK